MVVFDEWSIREIASLLRKLYPVRGKVRIRRGGSDLGGCFKNGRNFTIWLAAGLAHDAAVLTLTHEWAHVMTWGSKVQKHHGVGWARAYARCYAAIHNGSPD